MEKILYDDVKFGRLICEDDHSGVMFCRKINRGDHSDTLEKPVSSIVKLNCPEYIDLLLEKGLSLEEKTFNAKEIAQFPEIVVPNGIVYDSRDNFMGYMMPYKEGDTFNAFNKRRFELFNIYPCEFYYFAQDFFDLEKIVKRSDDIVFADLLNGSNILFDGNDFSFVDYDGFQTNGYMSDLFFNYENDNNSKYINGSFFTKQFDIKQIIYLYFKCVFAYDLSKLDVVPQAYIESIINSDFNKLGLDNDDIKNKVLRLYTKFDNEYLGDTLFELSDHYDLCCENGKRYVKKK